MPEQTTTPTTPAPLIRGIDFFQLERPFRVDDTAVLPSGREIRGAAARVYNLLRIAAEEGHCFPVGRHHGPPGFVPTWVLREPWAGGSAGDRRLRDLRAAGVRIDQRRFESGGEAGDGGSWMWALLPPKLVPAGTASTRRAQLAGLRFHLAVGRPPAPAGEAIDVTPGRLHLLAPSPEVAAAATAITPAAAADLYRLELLERFHAGTLCAGLADIPMITLWREATVPFDPLPVVARALTRLGASQVSPPPPSGAEGR